MSCHTASPSPAVQPSSEANQGSSSQAEYLLELQGRYQNASQMCHFQYHVGEKHRNKRYDQVFEDQGYVSWVKAHVKEEKATREQLRFLHYIHLQEREAGAVVEPAPQEPVEDLAASEYDLVDQEAEAVTVEQLAERVGQVEQVLQGLIEQLRI